MQGIRRALTGTTRAVLASLIVIALMANRGFQPLVPYSVIPSAPPDDLERLWLYRGRLMMVTAIGLWLIAAPNRPRRVEAIEEPARKVTT